MKTVILDPGHGGPEPGAIFEGRREKDDNLSLALEVGKILADNGVRVLFTRTTDVFDSPMQKAQIANWSGADYFVSFHRNAMPIPGSASGVQTLVYENQGVPALMAKNINQQLEQTGFTNLGVLERPGLIVLRRTQMPAVLVETGFLDNAYDNRLFDENFYAIARAIADGILMTIQQEEQEEPEYYQVQTGSYRNRSLADQQLKQLEEQGFPAFLVYDDGYYKVRVGAFLNLDNAVRMEQSLRSYGYNTVMVKEERVS